MRKLGKNGGSAQSSVDVDVDVGMLGFYVRHVIT